MGLGSEEGRERLIEVIGGAGLIIESGKEERSEEGGVMGGREGKCEEIGRFTCVVGEAGRMTKSVILGGTGRISPSRLRRRVASVVSGVVESLIMGALVGGRATKLIRS